MKLECPLSGGHFKTGGSGLIILTKLNNEPVTINDRQIEYIEQIPESKVTMMNGRYYIVRESPQEIIDKVIRFDQKIMSGIKVEV